MPQRINGDYELTLHVEDPRADEPLVRDLGKLTVDFNEGSMDRTYDSMREDYKMYDKIVNYFPPEPPAKGATIPLFFSALLVGGLLVFIGSIFTNRANLSGLTFFGFIFMLTYIAVYGIIVVFWIGKIGDFQINLVNTLWIMVGLVPLTMMMMHLGLPEEKCEVPKYTKKKKDE